MNGAVTNMGGENDKSPKQELFGKKMRKKK